MQTQLYVREHFAEKITLEMMADRSFMSKWYFSKLFKRMMGVNFIDYLTGVRIDHARKLILSHPELRNYEIGEAVGFPNTRYFNKVFREATGSTPSEFRGGKP
jgi:two-component system response regulator YesN